MPDRDVDFLANEIDMMHGRGDPQIDAGMGLGKPAEPVDQPFGGEIRRRADGQGTRVLALHDALGARGDPVERVADHAEIFATGVGDDQPLALAIEKLDAERRFQRLDLMADGALGDAQLFGRAREAFAARRGLEGLERVERWQLAGHARSFMRKSRAR